MWGSEYSSYYHVCTDGTSLEWMFLDDEDFIAGVNRIAVCQLLTGVKVVAFVLMDNHLHLLLFGSRRMCMRFIHTYKVLTGKWIGRKYGKSGHLRGLPVEVILVKDEEELMDLISYIDRNPLRAGFRYLPTEYRWGSARYVFKIMQRIEAEAVSDIGLNAVRRKMHTRVKLPKDWLVDEFGMYVPDKTFLDVEKIQSVYKSPARYAYFMAKKLEGKVELSMARNGKVFLSDKELRPVVAEISMKMFNKADARVLDVNSKLQIAKELRRSYACTVKQIGRMLGLKVESLSDFI